MIVLKSHHEIDRMREAGRVVAQILQLIEEKVRPGITTLELDLLAESECRRRKVKPAFKGYGGFPYTICASPNEIVVHGFPTKKPLQEGDILSVDFGVIQDGYYGDAAKTFPVGNVSEEAQKLMAATKSSLDEAIQAIQPNARLSDISNAVQTYVECRGYSVVREFVGHGIGKRLHESPQIPNFGPSGQGPRLKPGMTLAIEPMINAGKPGVKILEDGWTAVTLDGRLSAHFEHTVAVTENGPVILTLP